MKTIDPASDPVGAAKEARKVRRELENLTNQILLFLDAVDTAFMKDRTVPNEAGGKLARLVAALELANDSVRYFTLGVDYRKENKPKTIERLKRKAGKR